MLRAEVIQDACGGLMVTIAEETLVLQMMMCTTLMIITIII